MAAYGLQFHPELRREDFDRWRSVPGYLRLVEESGDDWDRLAVALERATPELKGSPTSFSTAGFI